MTLAAPAACTVPQSSALQPQWVAAAWFSDAYRAPLRKPPPDVVEIFFAIFGHHPQWIKQTLLLRNRLARRWGLAVPADSGILHPTRKSAYTAGDTIGPWPVFSISAHELVVGRDNAHLDFRLSILRELHGPSPTVVVSTVCLPHNWAGKVYLFFIVPFHRWGVKFIIQRALRAGRL